MRKFVLLRKRAAGLSVAELQARWLHGYGPLAAREPSLRRYVLSPALPQGYAKAELLFDGIEELWFDEREGFEQFRRSVGLVNAEAPGLFDAVRTVVMPIELHVIKDGPIPENAVKSIEFVNRRPGMGLAPFRRYWLEVHGPLASTIPVLHRYEQNHVAPMAYEGGAAPAYDGLAITWFASTADMKHGTTTPEYRATRADEPNFLPDAHLPVIITREHELRG